MKELNVGLVCKLKKVVREEIMKNQEEVKDIDILICKMSSYIVDQMMNVMPDELLELYITMFDVLEKMRSNILDRVFKLQDISEAIALQERHPHG